MVISGALMWGDAVALFVPIDEKNLFSDGHFYCHAMIQCGICGSFASQPEHEHEAHDTA